MDLELVWDIYPSVLAGYRVRYKLHSSSVWTVFGTVSTNYCVITGFINCNNYDFEIMPICYDDERGVGYGPATVTANVALTTYECNPNAYFTLKTTNTTQPGNNLNIVQVGCDLGSTTTSGMPVLAATTYSQTIFLYAWTTINYTMDVANTMGTINAGFSAKAFRNGILEYSSPIYSASGFSTISLPISLLHPPAAGDLIELILYF